jgi:hypothetical protein
LFAVTCQCTSVNSLSNSHANIVFGEGFVVQVDSVSAHGNYCACGSFAKLRRRTSDHGVVFALPESRSARRLPISASQAACTPSSTLPPRFEIRESARASCSSIESDSAFSSRRETFRRHFRHEGLAVVILAQVGLGRAGAGCDPSRRCTDHNVAILIPVGYRAVQKTVR